MTEKKSFTYADAGVDIKRGDEAKKRIKSLVESTYTDKVIGGYGHFGGCFSGRFEGIENPVTVSSCDSVGTKIKVACFMHKHDTVGIDIVHHCANDIAVMGAQPLFFLDYLGIGKSEPDMVEQIIGGLAVGCKNAKTALIAGEIAEMPEIYHEGEYDLAGFIVGVVDKNKILDGSRIKPGDLIYGFKSNGLHTNGYTLARKIAFEHMGWKADQVILELSESIGEALLRPHKLYLPMITRLRDNPALKGFAHVTGGGIVGNLKRIFPKGLTFKIDSGNWQIPPLFTLLQKSGNVAAEEMFRTFNMGIGLVYVINRDSAEEVASVYDKSDDIPIRIGEVISGDKPALKID